MESVIILQFRQEQRFQRVWDDCQRETGSISEQGTICIYLQVNKIPWSSHDLKKANVLTQKFVDITQGLNLIYACYIT
jgi:hypothetical protein